MTGGPAASAPTLTLADGSSWVIVAGDPDAAPVIETLAAIMRLAPADEPPLLRADGSAVPPVRGSAGWPAREFRVVVRDGPEARLPADTRGDGPVLVAARVRREACLRAVAHHDAQLAGGWR